MDSGPETFSISEWGLNPKINCENLQLRVVDDFDRFLINFSCLWNELLKVELNVSELDETSFKTSVTLLRRQRIKNGVDRSYWVQVMI